MLYREARKMRLLERITGSLVFRWSAGLSMASLIGNATDVKQISAFTQGCVLFLAGVTIGIATALQEILTHLTTPSMVPNEAKKGVDSTSATSGLEASAAPSPFRQGNTIQCAGIGRKGPCSRRKVYTSGNDWYLCSQHQSQERWLRGESPHRT